MQFRGQTHLIRVALPARRRHARGRCRRCSRTAYFARFQVRLPEIKAVLVNLVTSVIGRRRALPDRVADRCRRPRDPGARTPSSASAGCSPTAAGTRRTCSIGSSCRSAARIAGPAIVQQIDATTLIEPGAAATGRRHRQPAHRRRGRRHERAIDPITLAVIQASLGQVCNEMDIAFSRSAFSPVIAEADDRSSGIYDKDTGALISQGELGPAGVRRHHAVFDAPSSSA